MWLAAQDLEYLAPVSMSTGRGWPFPPPPPSPKSAQADGVYAAAGQHQGEVLYASAGGFVVSCEVDEAFAGARERALWPGAGFEGGVAGLRINEIHVVTV